MTNDSKPIPPPGALVKSAIFVRSNPLAQLIIRTASLNWLGVADILAENHEQKRLEHFMAETQRLLPDLQSRVAALEAGDRERARDLILNMADDVVKAASKNKHQRFARILARQVGELISWDEADEALLLVSALCDFDIVLLEHISASAGVSRENLEPRRDTLNPLLSLLGVAEMPHSEINRRISSSLRRLVTRDLIRELDTNKHGPMHKFAESQQGRWFLRWIQESPSSPLPTTGA